MSYTLSQLQDEIAHALAKTGGVTSPLTSLRIINSAIRKMSAAHPWEFLMEDLSLNIVSAQNYVDLPSNFGALHPGTLQRVSVWAEMRPTSFENIVARRASAINPITAGFGFYYAVRAEKQVSATVLPVWRLELYPTPTESETGGIIGMYQRVPADLASSSDFPDMPSEYHDVLADLCRALATQKEEESNTPDWQRYREGLAELKRRAADSQNNLGMMEGSVSRRHIEYGNLYPTEIVVN